jgi:transcriptional regulator with XRE-family HTH domain
MSEIAQLYRSESYSHRVAAEIRAHAARQGIMQKDLAKALGLKPSGITNRMRGKVAFTLDELEVLARLFEIEPADLMPKCAVRDLNPEPAGLVPPLVEPDAGFAKIIPFAPLHIHRPPERRRPARRIPRHTNAPFVAHLAVAR